MKTIKLLAIFSLAATSCGDNLTREGTVDAPRVDAPIDAPNFPEAPALGAQIERMGRPAVNTALNSAFITPAGEITAKKDAYNEATDPAMWPATLLATGRIVRDEFATNLGIIDVLDQGAFANTMGAGNGCGNAILYNGPGGTATPMTTSYDFLGGFLALDMLFVDTGKMTCNNYLSVEFGVVTGSHSQCGGRTPTHDVIDVSYSALAAGLQGFDLTDPAIPPLVGDGVDPHADVDNDAFPFFGAPCGQGSEPDCP